MKGLLLGFFPKDSFTLLTGEDALRSYTFNTHKIDYQFCQTCGTQPFAYGVGPDGSEIRAINLRCVPSLELANLAIQAVDGASQYSPCRSEEHTSELQSLLRISYAHSYLN